MTFIPDKDEVADSNSAGPTQVSPNKTEGFSESNAESPVSLPDEKVEKTHRTKSETGVVRGVAVWNGAAPRDACTVCGGPCPPLKKKSQGGKRVCSKSCASKLGSHNRGVHLGTRLGREWIVSNGIATLDLGKGRTLRTDASLLPAVAHFPWWAKRSMHTHYARTKTKGRWVYFHHLIAGYPLNGMVIDHLDRDGLNCRRSNLRLATPSQNSQNMVRKHRSDCRGVRKHGNRFVASIGGERIGSYPTPEEARRAYDKRAIEKYGPQARLNFPTRARAMGFVIGRGE